MAPVAPAMGTPSLRHWKLTGVVPAMPTLRVTEEAGLSAAPKGWVVMLSGVLTTTVAGLLVWIPNTFPTTTS